jgi:hypothetical protein
MGQCISLPSHESERRRMGVRPREGNSRLRAGERAGSRLRLAKVRKVRADILGFLFLPTPPPLSLSLSLCTETSAYQRRIPAAFRVLAR